jgi:hypothetical protein
VTAGAVAHACYALGEDQLVLERRQRFRDGAEVERRLTLRLGPAAEDRNERRHDGGEAEGAEDVSTG